MILETKLVDIVEAKKGEMNIANVLLTSLLFPLIGLMNRF